jgi:hypothetical protein
MQQFQWQSPKYTKGESESHAKAQGGLTQRRKARNDNVQGLSLPSA